MAIRWHAESALGGSGGFVRRFVEGVTLECLCAAAGFILCASEGLFLDAFIKSTHLLFAGDVSFRLTILLRPGGIRDGVRCWIHYKYGCAVNA